jgi:hypothetical protein
MPEAMAGKGKSGNGRNATTERMVEVLERIDRGVSDLRGDLDNLRRDLTSRIDQTNARLDNLIEVSGAVYRDHEARLKKLETEVQRLVAGAD